jgi:hypothetical protein
MRGKWNGDFSWKDKRIEEQQDQVEDRGVSTNPERPWALQRSSS